MAETPVPKHRKQARNVVLWVTGAFFLGIFTWGMSMWAVKKSLFRTVNLIMNERTRIKSIEAWVHRAEEYKLTYEFVLAHPQETKGKPVVWDIRGKKITWQNPEKVVPDQNIVVGVVKDVGPGGVTLQYLGYK